MPDARDGRPLPYLAHPGVQSLPKSGKRPGAGLISGKLVSSRVGDVSEPSVPPMRFDAVRRDVSRMAGVPVDRVAVAKVRDVYRGVFDSGGQPYHFTLSAHGGLHHAPASGDDLDAAWAKFYALLSAEQRQAVRVARETPDVSVFEKADVGDDFAKAIKHGPSVCFVYAPLPTRHVATWQKWRRKLLPKGSAAQDFDHATLIYASGKDLRPYQVRDAVSRLRAFAERRDPIRVRAQGWAYFDGAEFDGEQRTALVLLLDAPGLDTLVHKFKEELSACGIEASKAHAFVAHVTFAYLPVGARVAGLPVPNQTFDVDRVVLSNRKDHTIYLGRKVMKKALPKKEKKPEGGKKAPVGGASKKVGGSGGKARYSYPSEMSGQLKPQNDPRPQEQQRPARPADIDPVQVALQLDISPEVLADVARRFVKNKKLRGRDGFSGSMRVWLQGFSEKHGLDRDWWGRLFDKLVQAPPAA